MGHSVRTCLIAMRIGRTLGLSDPELADLYYAALLKDAGCSTNAARIQTIFGGDEIVCKRDMKVVDWSNIRVSLGFAVSHAARGASVGVKFRKLLGMLGNPTKVMDGLTEARCTRGSQIALKLGFGQPVADAIYALDEHWDGHGSPGHKSGEQIPVLARILCLAQSLEVLVGTFGIEEGFGVVVKRSGTWFPDEVVRASLNLMSDSELFSQSSDESRSAALKLATPAAIATASPANVDAICDAFASIVDAKSTFTGEHSTRVMGYAVEIATAFGFEGERLTELRRAALLHDIGKLGVSSAILEKTDRLTDEEFAAVKQHPYQSHQILKRVEGFERIAEIAAAHHEKLNGRGYFRGLEASDLDLDMRILGVADIFDALTAKRPYRDAMPYEKALAILEAEAIDAIDPDCVAVLRELYSTGLAKAA